MSAVKTLHKFHSCYRCKGQHTPAECKFETELYHNCGKQGVGHIKKACRLKAGNTNGQRALSKRQRTKGRAPEKVQWVNQLRWEGESDTEDMSFHTIFSMTQDLPKVAPITRTININGMEVTYEVDTGCGVTIISKQQYTEREKTATSEINPYPLK